MIKFACPSCAKKYAVKDELGGRKVKCKACSGAISIPTAAAVSAPLDDIVLEPVGEPAPVSMSMAPAGAAFAGAGAVAFAGAPAAPTASTMMPPTMHTAPRLAPSSAQEARTFMSRTAIGLFVGLASSTIMAVVWGLIIYMSGYELGFLAIIMGLVVGISIASSTPNRGPAQGIAAIAFVLFGLILGKAIGGCLLAMNDPDFAEIPKLILILVSPLAAVKMLGLYDVLWIGLAIFNAWKICGMEHDA